MSDSMASQSASSAVSRSDSHDVSARRSLRLPSWGGSLVFHLIVLLLLILFFNMARKPHSAPGEPVRAASIVLKETLADDQRVYTDADSDAASNANATDSATAPQNIDAMLEERFADDTLSASIEELPNAIGVGTPQVGGAVVDFGKLNTGAGFAGSSEKGTGALPGAGKSRVRFFGTQGTANRFVFVVDRSGSMSDARERPFRAAKRELKRAIDSLQESNSFNIIFYNDKTSSLFPTLYPATDVNKKQAKNHIDIIRPYGGTEHEGALVKALRQRPEVLFFLTDGDESDALRAAALDRVSRLNTGAAQINAIQFGPRPGDGSTFLHRLTRENNGQFQYVNIQSF